MNYEFYFFGFIPLYTLINLIIFSSVYKKWIKDKILTTAFPKWNGTNKPVIFISFRLSFIIASYFTPWIFLSSPRAFLFNLFIFLPVHLLIDEITNQIMRRKIQSNSTQFTLISKEKDLRSNTKSEE